MKRSFLFGALLTLFSLALGGFVLAQDSQEPPLFVFERQIGARPPSVVQYDPNFDRFVWTDTDGQLVLADARTYDTQHVLYESGAYNAYRFSHDGRYLALAIDQRVELWNTQTGTLSTMLEPSGALLVNAPLYFSRDDGLLLLNTVVPAPPELRRSENDTSNLPWLWDLENALDEIPRSTLPNRVNAYPFYDFRYGMAIGSNRYLVGGFPQRVRVLDAGNDELPTIADLSSSRGERDPINVWESAVNPLMYIAPDFGAMVQINTESGTLFRMPLGRDLRNGTMDQVDGFTRTRLERTIGAPSTQYENSLLRLIYGDNYRAEQGYAAFTVILLDLLQPLTISADQSALLLYTYNESYENGMMELIRPPDITQMVLSPDTTRLMVRRASGRQPIEIYNIETGELELTIFPAEPDGGLLAYNADGSVIISDFQRFDAATGEVLAEIPQYTQPFERVTLTDEGQTIVTFRGSEWQMWDADTTAPVGAGEYVPAGFVVRSSPDGLRVLTQSDGQNGIEMQIYNAVANERRTLVIPHTGGINSILPSEDWEQFLVQYSSGDVAVFTMSDGRIFSIGADNLPPDVNQVGWVDNGTIYAQSYTLEDYRTNPIYGLDYHVSGLPRCLVDTFPENWQAWLPVWEELRYRLDSQNYALLNQRICAALPQDAESVIPALTPTPNFYYESDATRIPGRLPDVPTCLTSQFYGEQLDYAALWRELTTDLSEEEIANLEDLICEGLITSLSGIQPTPTVNPNLLNAVTATPVEAVAQSIDTAEQAISVMTIDISTGNRSVGSYLPPMLTDSPQETYTQEQVNGLVNSFFYNQFGYTPYSYSVSPDGTRFAMLGDNGFVSIYRLSKSVQTLVSDEQNAVAEREADTPRSIGLPATPTESYAFVGQPLPTLTPTVTPTAPAPVSEGTVETQLEEVCPVQQLFDLSAPPADFAVSGRLLVPPREDIHAVWVLEPETGELYPDERLPMCGINENCNYSFDVQYILRIAEAVTVSRADGSNPVELFAPQEAPVFPSDFNWRDSHTLRWSFDVFIAEGDNPGYVRHYVDYDAEANTLSEPLTLPEQPRIHELETSIRSVQPMIERWLVLSTPYDNGESKYYLYDRDTETWTYFARGNIDFEWHPLGTVMYYRFPGTDDVYQFDPETGIHRIYGERLPQGQWSRDGRYRITWLSADDEWIDELRRGELPSKVQVWDTATNTIRRYCIPETGTSSIGEGIVWSPDSRYVVFTTRLHPDMDVVPTATTTPDIVPPTATMVPLEVQRDYGYPRTMLLDIQTGSVTVISKDDVYPTMWIESEAVR
jgi:WD40 repeat protein